MKYCVKCGQQLPDQALFCSKCGAKQPEMEQTPVEEEKAEAVVVENQTETTQKPKTDLSAFMKVKTFTLWGIFPIVLLIINLIFGALGTLKIFSLIPNLIFAVLGIVMCTINFVKRINRKTFNHEAGIAIALAVLDSVSLLCAFILVTSI